MKHLARRILVNCFALFLLEFIAPGFHIFGGFVALFIASVVLTLLFLIVKPILQVLSLPLNAITFGLFSFVINAILLWLAGLFVKQISIQPFAFPRIIFAGFVIPSISIQSYPILYIVLAAILYGIIACINWIIQD
jgi:putative membrane protein